MGRDKALLDFRGQPLWRHQLETLRQLSPVQLLLSGPARSDHEAEPVADEIPEAGPLAGVAAALARARAPHLVVLAVDLPDMTAAFLRSLLADCRDRLGVVARTAEGFEPLAAVYPTSCAGLARQALEGGEFSMQALVERALKKGFLQAREISETERPLFANLNTPADYERSRHCEIDPAR